MSPLRLVNFTGLCFSFPLHANLIMPALALLSRSFYSNGCFHVVVEEDLSELPDGLIFLHEQK